MTNNKIYVPVRHKALPENTKIVTVEALPCMVCHKSSLVQITEYEYYQLKSGEGHVQDIFPDIDPGFREMLITGTHSDCWDKMFADADADDDEGSDYLRDTF